MGIEFQNNCGQDSQAVAMGTPILCNPVEFKLKHLLSDKLDMCL